MSTQTIKLVQNVLAGNDNAAEKNRARLDAAGVLAINIIAAPGAGKTSFISKTIQAMRDEARIGVIEGDIAGTIDTEKVLAAGARDAVQINTNGGCHLEANMVQRALDDFDLASLDLIFIENVGNLVCPTHWALGERIKLCLSSAAEGHDKPLKYPDIFAQSDVIVLNKMDLSELADFDRACFYEYVRALNRHAPIFEISCRTGAGIGAWSEWLGAQVEQIRSEVKTYVH